MIECIQFFDFSPLGIFCLFWIFFYHVLRGVEILPGVKLRSFLENLCTQVDRSLKDLLCSTDFQLYT